MTRLVIDHLGGEVTLNKRVIAARRSRALFKHDRSLLIGMSY